VLLCVLIKAAMIGQNDYQKHSEISQKVSQKSFANSVQYVAARTMSEVEGFLKLN